MVIEIFYQIITLFYSLINISHFNALHAQLNLEPVLLSTNNRYFGKEIGNWISFTPHMSFACSAEKLLTIFPLFITIVICSLLLICFGGLYCKQYGLL